MGAVGKALIPLVVNLRIQGMSVTNIARKLEKTTPSISSTLKLPEVIEAIRQHNADVRSAMAAGDAVDAMAARDTLRRLTGGQPYADDETGETLYAVPAAVQKAAASDLADRSGWTRETVMQVMTTDAPPDLSGMSKAELLAILEIDAEDG